MITEKDNIKTSNVPILDEMVFNLKKLALGCVIKDQTKADANETVDIERNANMYISCVLNQANYRLFKYKQADFEAVGLWDQKLINECLVDSSKIPLNYVNKLTELKTKEFLDNYEEENPYYRMLNGLPPIGEEGLILTEDMIPTGYKGLSVGSYIHELPDTQIDILHSTGIIDSLVEADPSLEYLKHTGSKKISIFNARYSEDFQLLYAPDDVPTVVLNRFKTKMESNRVYTLKCIYNNAFKIGSEDHYDQFIRIFILIQTMIDMIVEIPDMLLKREVFDRRTIQLIFENNGVDYFPEIPYRYQIAMVRNLNKLIKYKSTTKCVVDICSLFGFDNIQLFKYYLLRDRRVDPNTQDYVFATKEQYNYETDQYETVEDFDSEYELKFLKVPIDGIADDYMRDKSLIKSYDDITLDDKYWDGDLTHDDVRKSIVEFEFNCIESKYRSIDTVYSLTELMFQTCYFFNMIFDDVLVEENLTIKVPEIASVGTFKFTDVIVYMFALMYEYNGIEDTIMDTQSKILAVKGFNFKADLAKLSAYVEEKGYTLEELGCDFQIPEGSILTYKQMMSIFTNNKKVYDHIIHELFTANNKDIYDIYYKLYDSLMLTDLTLNYFRDSKGNLAPTYTDFLSDRDSILYNSILSIRKLETESVKKQKITDIIDACVYAIEDYLELDEYKLIFNFFPGVGTEAVRKYLYNVINFFKSYKVQYESINVVYIFDDKLDNKINIIDRILIEHDLTKADVVHALSKIYIWGLLNPQDPVNIRDTIFIDFVNWIDKYYYEKMSFKEYLNTISNTNKSDIASFIEILDMDSALTKTENIFTKLDEIIISEQLSN